MKIDFLRFVRRFGFGSQRRRDDGRLQGLREEAQESKSMDELHDFRAALVGMTGPAGRREDGRESSARAKRAYEKQLRKSGLSIKQAKTATSTAWAMLPDANSIEFKGNAK